MSGSGALLRLFTLSLLAALTGCISAEARQLAAARQARSWAATAHLTTEALDRGAIPRLYARQILQAGQEAEEQLTAQPEWGRVPTEAKQSLEEALDQLAFSVGEATTRHE
jgi:hypothetical protein